MNGCRRGRNVPQFILRRDISPMDPTWGGSLEGNRCPVILPRHLKTMGLFAGVMKQAHNGWVFPAHLYTSIFGYMGDSLLEKYPHEEQESQCHHDLLLHHHAGLGNLCRQKELEPKNPEETRARFVTFSEHHASSFKKTSA